MRHKLRALVGVPLLACAGIAVAGAASLNLGVGTVTTVAAGPCAIEAVPVTEASPILGGLLGYRAVRVTVPASCAGLTLDVTVHANGSAIATGAAAAVPAGDATVTVNSTYGWYSGNYAFALVFNGWHVPVAA